MKAKMISGKGAASAVLILLFMIVVPIITDNYSMTVMNAAIIYAISALGLTILLGMGGQMSFAAISFMGFGAFVTAQLSKNAGMQSLLALICAMVITSLFAMIVGLALFRLRGSYFTFSTIGFVQIMNCIMLNYKPFTGGPDGTSGIPRLNLMGYPIKDLKQWFYVLMFLAICCMLIVERIRKTSLGRSLASVRDNEIAAQSLGVNVYRTKIVAFTIAGAFAGLAGGLLAQHNSYISASLFTYDTSVTFLIMLMLGGVNSTVGTFMVAVLVTMLPEWLRPLQQYLKLIYGVSIILLMVFMPMGLAGVVQMISDKVMSKIKRKGGNRDDRSKTTTAHS